MVVWGKMVPISLPQPNTQTTCAADNWGKGIPPQRHLGNFDRDFITMVGATIEISPVQRA
jgi:hypothetical protein